MKILLIRPPIILSKKAEPVPYGLPLGIASIAAVLKKNRYDVAIFDSPSASSQDVRNKILQKNPDIIGISNQFVSQFEDARLVAEIAKDINRDFLVIVGGSHPSSCPEDFFEKTDCVDIIVIGEGEYAMLEIIERISKKMPLEDMKGIAVKRHNEIIINPKRSPIENIDELPYPAYELLGMNTYFKLTNTSSGRPAFFYPDSNFAVNFITSRGCPYDCIFCSVHSVMGKRWRSHSPEYIIGHIRFLIEKYKIKHFHFEDDNLTLDKNRFKKILDAILNAKLNISWDTPNGIRADFLDEEILTKAKRSGCVYLIIGVESGDQSVLDNIIRKRLSLKEVEKVAAFSKKIKLNLEAFFTIGFPGETVRNMMDTVNFAFKLQFKYSVYPMIFIATPLPGTRLYDMCLEKGYITKEDFHYSKIPSSILKTGMIETEDFNLKNIKWISAYFRTVRNVLTIVNFSRFCLLSPEFVIRKIIYLFKIFFIDSKKVKFTPKAFLRNFVRYNFYIAS